MTDFVVRVINHTVEDTAPAMGISVEEHSKLSEILGKSFIDFMVGKKVKTEIFEILVDEYKNDPVMLVWAGYIFGKALSDMEQQSKAVFGGGHE